MADRDYYTAEGLCDEMRGQAGDNAALLALIDEAERRMRNGSETIGAYQRLTASDYPGTLQAHLGNGRIVMHERARHQMARCAAHSLFEPSCDGCRARLAEIRAGG